MRSIKYSTTMTSITSSANGNTSPRKSLKSIGPKERTMATSQTLLPTPAVQEPGWKNRIPVHKDGTPASNPNERWYDKETGRLMQKGLQQVITHTMSSQFSPVASPANPSVKLDEEKERQTTATSGRICLQSLGMFDQTGLSLRMFEDSLLGTTAWFSKQCALTWKAKVTKQGRTLFQLAPSVRRTGEKESGLLHTPRTLMIEETPENFRKRMNSKRKNDRKNGLPNLAVQVANLLPTPDSNCGSRGVAKEWKPIRPSGQPAQKPINESVNILGQTTGAKLRLQPAMTEWMMGFPEKWVEFNTVPPSGEKKH